MISRERFVNGKAGEHKLIMTEKEPDIFQELGLRNPPRFVDHESPRPVDLDVLRAYHRGELDEEDAKDVDYLTSLFRDWHDASKKVLSEIVNEDGNSSN